MLQGAIATGKADAKTRSENARESLANITMLHLIRSIVLQVQSVMKCCRTVSANNDTGNTMHVDN